MTQVLSSATARKALLGVVVVAAALRVPGLNRDISHDEAYSWTGFASQSYGMLLTSYQVPNNHILHTAAMRLASQVLGSDEEWVLRLPAYLAGVAAVPAVAALTGAVLASPTAAVVAGVWVAVHPAAITYSRTARGYSQLLLLTTLAWWLMVRARSTDSTRDWVAYAVAGFLASWTLPSGALAVAGLGLWATVDAWRQDGWRVARRPVAATVVAGAASLVAYADVFAELREASEQWGVDVWSASGGVSSSIAALGSLLAGGLSLFGLLAAAGLAWLVRRRHEAVQQTLALVVAAAGMALVTGVAGQARSYFYLFPVFAIGASAWVLAPQLRIRQVGLLLSVVGAGVFAAKDLTRAAPSTSLQEIGAAYSTQALNSLLVAPVFLDPPLDLYTREAEATSLMRALRAGRMGDLMLATRNTDPRSSLESYHLYHMIDGDQVLADFYLRGMRVDTLASSGPVRLLAMRKQLPVFPPEQVSWEGADGSVGLRLADPAMGSSLSLGILAEQADFVAVEQTRFASQSDGFMAVAYVLRGAETIATLCESRDGAWVPLPVYRGKMISRQVVTATDGSTWQPRAHLVLVQRGHTYNVCATGPAPGERYVGDLLYTFYPFL